MLPFCIRNDCNKIKKKSVFDNSQSLQYFAIKWMCSSGCTKNLSAKLVMVFMLIEGMHSRSNVCTFFYPRPQLNSYMSDTITLTYTYKKERGEEEIQQTK